MIVIKIADFGGATTKVKEALNALSTKAFEFHKDFMLMERSFNSLKGEGLKKKRKEEVLKIFCKK